MCNRVDPPSKPGNDGAAGACERPDQSAGHFAGAVVGTAGPDHRKALSCACQAVQVAADVEHGRGSVERAQSRGIRSVEHGDEVNPGATAGFFFLAGDPLAVGERILECRKVFGSAAFDGVSQAPRWACVEDFASQSAQQVSAAGARRYGATVESDQCLPTGPSIQGVGVSLG